jgi:hypothetical protein
MRTFYWLVLMSIVALAAACNRQPPQPQSPFPAPTPIGTIRQVMESEVATNADVLFNSVAVTVSATGTDEKQPKTDEDWDQVRHAAFTLAEATNLLLIPGRRVSTPETENVSNGPTELPPIKIQERLAASPDKWTMHVMDLRNVALQALKATTDKSVPELSEVGEAIDKACENCHLEFWYPDEKPLGASGAPRSKEVPPAKP